MTDAQLALVEREIKQWRKAAERHDAAAFDSRLNGDQREHAPKEAEGCRQMAVALSALLAERETLRANYAVANHAALMFTDEILRLEAERDTALAVVERVRAQATEWDTPHGYMMSQSLAGQRIAALLPADPTLGKQKEQLK